MVALSKLGTETVKERRKREAAYRKLEIDDEFRELQERWNQATVGVDYESVFERALYAPPWRDLLNVPHDLELEEFRYGPFYGPQNENQYSQQLMRFGESLAGGGLWDHEEEGQRPDTVKKPRYDHETVVRYAKYNYLTPTERRVYSAFWIDLKSWRAIATMLGVEVTSIRWHIHNIRKAAGSTE